MRFFCICIDTFRDGAIGGGGERVRLLLLWKDLPQLSPILGKIGFQLSREGEGEFEIN